MPATQLDTNAIIQRLAQASAMPEEHEPRLPGLRGEPARAAVLLPLFRHQSAWHLLFIRRAEHHLDRHSGEVAFPGGKVEPDDTGPRHTALREAEEEIGLNADAVEILGQLPTLRTASNFLVTPVVGRIDDPSGLTADPGEVARIFSIPLDWLAQTEHRRELDWQPPGQTSTRRVWVYRHYDGEKLWGVSARITLSLLQRLGC